MGKAVMGKSGWAFVRGLGLVVMALSGQAVFRGYFDREMPLLWGAFEWAGAWADQMFVIGAISLTGLLIALVAGFGVSRARKRAIQTAS